MIKENHKNTIHRLLQYRKNLDRISYLQKTLSMMGIKTTPVYSSQPGGSDTSDSTGNLAAKVGDLQSELLELQRDIELIDYAVSLLSQPKQLIIKVRFLTEGGQDKGASIVLKSHGRRYNWKTKNYRTYEKLRDEALEEMAGILGVNAIKVQ